MLERLGKYEILETIAAGGQGTVYRARESGAGDVVALKVMHPGHTGEVQYLEALRQEADLASRLDHPNIVNVFDFQVEGGTAYVAMEYVPGYCGARCSPGPPSLPEGRWSWPSRSPPQWPTPTSTGSSTGTSSPRTSSSPKTVQ